MLDGATALDGVDSDCVAWFVRHLAAAAIGGCCSAARWPEGIHRPMADPGPPPVHAPVADCRVPLYTRTARSLPSGHTSVITRITPLCFRRGQMPGQGKVSGTRDRAILKARTNEVLTLEMYRT